MTEREALKLALEALEAWETGCGTTEYLSLVEKAVTDIKEVLAQPAQEPVQCWKCGDMDAEFQAKCDVPACGMKETKQKPVAKVVDWGIEGPRLQGLTNDWPPVGTVLYTIKGQA